MTRQSRSRRGRTWHPTLLCIRGLPLTTTSHGATLGTKSSLRGPWHCCMLAIVRPFFSSPPLYPPPLHPWFFLLFFKFSWGAKINLYHPNFRELPWALTKTPWQWISTEFLHCAKGTSQNQNWQQIVFARLYTPEFQSCEPCTHVCVPSHLYLWGRFHAQAQYLPQCLLGCWERFPWKINAWLAKRPLNKTECHHVGHW